MKRVRSRVLGVAGGLVVAVSMTSCGPSDPAAASSPTLTGAAGASAGGTTGSIRGLGNAAGAAGNAIFPTPDDPVSSGGTTAGSGAGGVSSSALALISCPTFPESTDPKCSGRKGSVGTGPTFPDSATDGVGAEIQSGFVDVTNHRLVVAAGRILIGQSKYGAIFTVDLATGTRTFVSGTRLDATTGQIQRGQGPDLSAQTLQVAPGPDGWYVLSSPRTAGIIKVDPVTGDRTTLVNLAAAPFDSGLCASLSNHIAVAPDGKIYVPFNNIDFGKGIVEIVPGPLPTCRAIVNNKDDAIGSGAEPNDPVGVGYARSRVWVLDRRGASLFSIDPATGASQRETAKAGTPGAGPACLGTSGFALNDTIIWTFESSGTTGCATYPSVVAVDPVTGERIASDKVADGPQDGSFPTAIFPLPNEKNVVLIAQSNKIIVYDRNQNLTNNFSF